LFVCISNTESLIFNGSNLNIIIKDLLQNSKQTNIHFIILNNQLNQSIIENDFINKFDDKFIFKLTNELESISMFGNQKGNQLFGGGDGL
jgi:hypothetical protein